jgi:hypothetical protein
MGRTVQSFVPVCLIGASGASALPAGLLAAGIGPASRIATNRCRATLLYYPHRYPASRCLLDTATSFRPRCVQSVLYVLPRLAAAFMKCLAGPNCDCIDISFTVTACFSSRTAGHSLGKTDFRQNCVVALQHSHRSYMSCFIPMRAYRACNSTIPRREPVTPIEV